MDPAAAGQVPQEWPAYNPAAIPEGYESYDSNASSNATVVPGQQGTAGAQEPAADEAARVAQEQHAAAWAAYYAAQAQQAQLAQAQPGAAAGGASPDPSAAAAGAGAAYAEGASTGQTQAERDHIAAWQAYYAAQAQQAQAMAVQQGHVQGQGQPGYPAGEQEHLASPPADARYEQQGGYLQPQGQPQGQPGGAHHPYAAAGPGSTSVNSLHSQHAQQPPQAQQHASYSGRPTSGYGPQAYDPQQTGLEHGMAQMGIQQAQGQPRQ